MSEGCRPAQHSLCGLTMAIKQMHFELVYTGPYTLHNTVMLYSLHQLWRVTCLVSIQHQCWLHNVVTVWCMVYGQQVWHKQLLA
jgi:hypothetical protein